ncbi:hypothetical protein AUC69_02130 [Methyloceanibacter superfactus]|jgi:hypothetical protein|uniref:Uncharacterized protein n=1 Tax=Methyloceanibacter superfactus TaxID=1774969 RepID=A0A1E3VR71_9HYPH|nr:hypothetical protein [Methyloceanibacter superfactus]ODR96037.1 hypothetical protein AUC69_02130 [Methyloceanibacter superfactus]
MTNRTGPLLVFGAGLLLAASAPAPDATAKDCGAWNNWCRPACGDWNAWCAGQSLPDVLSRMQPKSYFADPKWVGETYPFPKDPDAATAPKLDRKANKRARRKQAER